MRQKPVTIEVRKNGQHWAVLAEEQLVALTVYEKGAHTLEAVLRGLLRYTSRKLFRQAVVDAMKPKAPEGSKPVRTEKTAASSPMVKAKKKSPVKSEQAHEQPAAPAPSPVPPETARDQDTAAQPS